MTKKTHEKQLERARAKRREAQAAQRQRRLLVAGVVLLVAVGVFVGALFLRGEEAPEAPEIVSDVPTSEPTTDVTAAANPCAAIETAEPPEPVTEGYDQAPEMQIDPSASYTATMETTCGTIELELYADAAPKTVNNFVFLAQDDYYAGVPFHRVLEGFVVQGGDPTGTGSGGGGQFPGYTFEDELERAQQVVEEAGGYPRGILAMANSGPNTNGSQFFIVQGDVVELPPAYTVFGQVTEGMDVVDRIVGGETGDQVSDPERILDVTIQTPPS